MPKAKWNLNTVYISERLQESLRPISRCALTTVVAPMGYGKTTAVNWYLERRARAETLRVIRVSVYSDNLAILWRSVQDAFARAGFDLLRGRPLPRAGGGRALLPVYRRLPPADRRAGGGVSLHARKPPAGERASDRRQP